VWYSNRSGTTLFFKSQDLSDSTAGSVFFNKLFMLTWKTSLFKNTILVKYQFGLQVDSASKGLDEKIHTTGRHPVQIDVVDPSI